MSLKDEISNVAKNFSDVNSDEIINYLEKIKESLQSNLTKDILKKNYKPLEILQQKKKKNYFVKNLNHILIGI